MLAGAVLPIQVAAAPSSVGIRSAATTSQQIDSSGAAAGKNCKPLETSGEEPALEGSAYQVEPVGSTGGTLIMSEWQTITTLNPYYAQANTDIEAATPALLGMVDTSYDLKYVPEISTNVPLVTNGGVKLCDGNTMQVEYTIKKDLKWSDGQPITCADVEATWKWIMDPGNTGLAGGTVGYEDIDSVTESKNKCLVHFKKIYSGYIGLFSPLLPKHYIESVPASDAGTALYPLSDVSKGVYSGPYIPSSYTAGAQLEYTPNAEYWKTAGREAPLEAVIFKYYPDNPDGMVAGYTQGEYDLGMNLNHTNLPSFFADPANPDAGFKPEFANVLTADSFTYENWSINNRRLAEKYGEAQVPAIKRALALIAPKQDVVDRANGGTVDPAGTNNISPLAWYYKEQPPSTYDPAAATTLLVGTEEVPGPWVMGEDGYLHLFGPEGKVLELDACTSARPGRIDAINLWAAEAKAIGIKFNTDPPYGVVPAQPNLFGEWAAVPADTPCNLIHGNYDVAEFGWVAPLDPTGSYNVYTCQGIPEDNPAHNGQNNTRTCDPVLDAAWEAVLSEIDPAKVKEAMGVVQDYYASNVIEIPLFFWKDVYLVSPRLHNVTGNPTTASVLWNIEDFWFDAQ
jgi:peptide/nickel transport system substrate-binding protein